MNSAADMGRHSSRATPSLHDSPYRQFKTATGRRSTYPLPIPAQTNPATSQFPTNIIGTYIAVDYIATAFGFFRSQESWPAIQSKALRTGLAPLNKSNRRSIRDGAKVGDLFQRQIGGNRHVIWHFLHPKTSPSFPPLFQSSIPAQPTEKRLIPQTFHKIIPRFARAKFVKIAKLPAPAAPSIAARVHRKPAPFGKKAGPAKRAKSAPCLRIFLARTCVALRDAAPLTSHRAPC